MEEVITVKKKERRRGLNCARNFFVKHSMKKWEEVTS